jgi:hypothetical protein
MQVFFPVFSSLFPAAQLSAAPSVPLESRFGGLYGLWRRQDFQSTPNVGLGIMRGQDCYVIIISLSDYYYENPLHAARQFFNVIP